MYKRHFYFLFCELFVHILCTFFFSFFLNFKCFSSHFLGILSTLGRLDLHPYSVVWIAAIFLQVTICFLSVLMVYVLFYQLEVFILFVFNVVIFICLLFLDSTFESYLESSIPTYASKGILPCSLLVLMTLVFTFKSSLLLEFISLFFNPQCWRSPRGQTHVNLYLSVGGSCLAKIWINKQTAKRKWFSFSGVMEWKGHWKRSSELQVSSLLLKTPEQVTSSFSKP